MTKYAKALIAALAAGGQTANLVASAHGWGHVDWPQVAAIWAAVAAIFAYPNVDPTPDPAPLPPV